MIVVFPMLTDESVSLNALPGVCKALERFVLIYELDAIMKITGLKILQVGGKLAAAAASSIVAKTANESSNVLSEDKMKTPEQEEREKIKFAMDVDKYEREKKSSSIQTALDTTRSLRDLGTVRVDMPDDQNLSLEPTYTIVTTTTGTRIIGVKVIPVPVKSKDDYSLADLLTVDASMKFFDVLGLRIYRKVIRSFWSLCRGLRVPFLKDRVITGDPEKDILWASTFHKRFVFCLLNYADMTDSQFFKNAGGIHKLHKLGWNSFVAMDDVNKRAIFCMKEFHGLCSTVSYQFIYSSLGKEQGKVYEKLEDIKRASSPFFKTSVSIKKLVGESKQTISNYLKRIS